MCCTRGTCRANDAIFRGSASRMTFRRMSTSSNRYRALVTEAQVDTTAVLSTGSLNSVGLTLRPRPTEMLNPSRDPRTQLAPFPVRRARQVGQYQTDTIGQIPTSGCRKRKMWVGRGVIEAGPLLSVRPSISGDGSTVTSHPGDPRRRRDRA